ncbi:PAS domain-containing protein [Erwinia aphidicola]|uniref:PAS domain-containing protein n=1 Tax=Erwinia aphidicola TaxID=68334 RepID=UPI0030CBBC4E
MNLADSRYQDDLLLMLAAAVRVIGSVIAANTEVVLHDLRSPEFSIAEIANPHVTGRRRGTRCWRGCAVTKPLSARWMRALSRSP